MLLFNSYYINCWVKYENNIFNKKFSLLSYGDVYPISNLAHFIAMLASPLSIMMLSVPLASVYNKYISIREIYQMQLTMPENVRYFIDDNIEFVDVTEQINQSLKYLGISHQLQEELDR
jgi:hypothetical protein